MVRGVVPRRDDRVGLPAGRVIDPVDTGEMRALLAVLLVAGLAGCREKPDAEEADPVKAADPPAATRFVAPMQTRERLLQDLSDQQRQAREREAAFDELTNRDR